MRCASGSCQVGQSQKTFFDGSWIRSAGPLERIEPSRDISGCDERVDEQADDLRARQAGTKQLITASI
jgi:hypothetical protein